VTTTLSFFLSFPSPSWRYLIAETNYTTGERKKPPFMRNIARGMMQKSMLLLAAGCAI
jgi:hypothetical protein